MVKPPKSMQPEGIHAASSDDSKKKKNPHRGGMDGDTFRHYMARKIQLQRQQFGIESDQNLPPTPIPQLELELQSSPKKRKVRFHEKVHQSVDQHQQQPDKHSDQGLTTLLERLKRKHGGVKKRKRSQITTTNNINEIEHDEKNSSIYTTTGANEETNTNTLTPTKHPKRRRPDLFFQGIAVLINGYTNPDNETLQRMLHRHGGELEKYETIRLTHIVASQLSFAKAKMYRKMKKPVPVVRPQWIVDCVDQKKLLPHGPYLLEQLQEKGCVSVKNFWGSVLSTETIKDEETPPRSPVRRTTMPLSSTNTDDFVHETMSSRNDDDFVDENADVDMTQYESSPYQGNLMLHTQLLDHTESHHFLSASPTTSSSDGEPQKQISTVPTKSNHAVDESSKSELPRQDEIMFDTHALIQGQGDGTTLDSEVPPFTKDEQPSFQESHSNKTSGPMLDSRLQGPPRSCEQTVEQRSGASESLIRCSQDADISQRQNDKVAESCEHGSSEPVIIPPPSNNSVHVVECKPSVECEGKESRICDQSIKEPVEDAKAINPNPRTDPKIITKRHRTTGTDPDFLESFFNNSRLSFIGSFKQRARSSPLKASATSHKVQDARRFVLHVDMDCFFAAVALRNFPQHRDKPVAISHLGRGISNAKSSFEPSISKTSSSECATCNYEARKYGIQKGMFLGRARELCPSLVVLPYDFEGYEEVSEQVADILYKYAAQYEGTVEQVSCDEAYLELQLIDGEDENVDVVILQIAECIREEIFSTTECTATIGIGANKLLAKLGTDKVKPDSCFVVQDYRDLMESLKVRELPGIGYRSERKLAHEGIVTVKDVWDLGDHAESELCRILGTATGKKILAFCQGEDDREIKPAMRKTIGAEINYGVRFDGPYGVDHLISGLAKEVEKRMHGAGVLGSKLTLKVKQRKENAGEPPKFLGHGSCHNLSRSIEIPGGVPTNESHVFSRLGMQLFQQLGVDVQDVRGMGIVVSKLSSERVVDASPNCQPMLKSWLQYKRDADDTPIPSPHEHVPSDFSDGDFNVQVNDDEEKDRCDRIEQEKAAAAHNDADEDEIQLPPQSQIRMSQVIALPSPLKRKITHMLEARKVITVDDDIEEFCAADMDRNYASLSHQWKQTSVKSLFKLAAVKAGRDTLRETLGESVSLTQLECLPLEMQLELASGRSADSKTRASKVSAPRRSSGPRALFPKPRDDNATTLPKSVEPDLIHVDDESIDDPKPLLSHSLAIEESSGRSFYLENVAPLKCFLNENDPKDEDANKRVHEFLETLVHEGRLHQVVKLLRSIKNRRDAWAHAAYGQILDKVDQSIREVTGCFLDRPWLML